MLAGTVEHGDSLGNRGLLGAGDMQWMTAGSGIMHQEMPKGDFAGRMHGFQLWANLPSSLKMTAPRYQDVKATEFLSSSMTTARRRGSSAAISGARPVRSTASPPSRSISTSRCRRAGRSTFKVDTYRNAFAYIFAGSGTFRDASKPLGVRVEKEVDGEELNIRDLSGNRTLVVFDSGDEVTVQAGDEGIRFLLVSGKPIEEPVAWHGPIVMNSARGNQAGDARTAERHLHQGRALNARALTRSGEGALIFTCHRLVFAVHSRSRTWLRGTTADAIQECATICIRRDRVQRPRFRRLCRGRAGQSAVDAAGRVRRE